MTDERFPQPRRGDLVLGQTSRRRLARRCRGIGLIAAATLVLALPSSSRAGVVFANDFEVGETPFTAGGVLPALGRTQLPVDGGGLLSPNQSTWLGPLGKDVTKGLGLSEIVELQLGGLTAGESYTVAFELLVGASWDGAASGYGTDAFTFSVDGTPLVDTAFSNGDQGIDYGAYSPQRYTDTHFADPGPPDVPAFTGAEYFRKQGPGYSGYYGIYAFSRGLGNPVLAFTASGPSATLQWARSSTGNSFGDSSDEYWALDDVLVVTGVPEPSAGARRAATALGGLLLIGLRSRRR